jgi:GDP-fucose transporter C1
MNTLCLQNIDAVMYQVARSLILPITVAMSPFMQSQRITFKVFLCCACITAGFIVGVFGESNFTVSTIGICFGVLSSLTTALHSFIIKSSFQNVKHNGAFDLVFYNNLFSAIFLAPILVIEVPALALFVTQNGWPALKVFLFGTLLAGSTGLLINLAGFLQIKTTSPVTHTVSSAARGVLQTLAARAILGEAITAARCLGIAVTLFGSCMYSYVKSIEMAQIRDYAKVEGRGEG